MRKIQITIDHETLRQIDRVGKSLDLKRSEIVRQALREWLRRRAIIRFEEEWISALRTRPAEFLTMEDDLITVLACASSASPSGHMEAAAPGQRVRNGPVA